MSSHAEGPFEGSPAEIYERHLVPALIAPWAREFAEFVVPKRGESALDIACGTGALTGLLADLVGNDGRVVGLDFDPDMVEVARSIRPDLEWHVADAQKMPFAVREFDLVTCHQGFQFLPDKPAGLQEMRRVLRSKGRLALAVWRSIEFCPGQHALSKALAKWVDPDVARLAGWALGDADTLQEIVGQAGFEDITLRAVTKSVQFRSAVHFTEVLIGGSSIRTREMLAKISPADRDGFTRDVAEMLKPYESPTGLSFPMEAHFLAARAP